MLDIWIKNALIIDGSGGEPFIGAVGVQGERIAAVGEMDNRPAGRVIDARGKCLSPGFIDIHGHSDISLMLDGQARSKVFQGVTSEVVGNCSYTPFPISADRRPLLRKALSAIDYADVNWRWHTLADYAQDLQQRGISLNVLPQVGHAAVRTQVIGPANRPASSAEIRAMQRLVAEAMEQGAVGISVGLTLTPSAYGDTVEVIELAKTAAQYGGIYSQHSRLNVTNHRAAVEEAIAVGRCAKIRVEVSHQKIVGPPFWHQIDDVLEAYQSAVSDGLDIGFDLYPYLAGMSSFHQLLPLWAMDGGVARMVQRLGDSQDRLKIRRDMEAGWFGGVPWDWSAILVTGVHHPALEIYRDETVAQVAERMNAAPLDAILTLVEQDDGELVCAFFTDSDQNVKTLMAHPLAVIGSDGLAVHDHGPLTTGCCHPRYFGAFPRLIEHYVQRENTLSLPEAIAKMTLRTAARLNLTDRGVIAPSKAADLVIFAPSQVRDNATFTHPAHYASGFSHVMVNGTLVIDEGKHTGARPGHVLLRQR